MKPTKDVPSWVFLGTAASTSSDPTPFQGEYSWGALDKDAIRQGTSPSSLLLLFFFFLLFPLSFPLYSPPSFLFSLPFFLFSPTHGPLFSCFPLTPSPPSHPNLLHLLRDPLHRRGGSLGSGPADTSSKWPPILFFGLSHGGCRGPQHSGYAPPSPHPLICAVAVETHWHRCEDWSWRFSE